MAIPSAEVCVEVEVDIIDCPGVRLPERESCFLRLFVFGNEVRSGQVVPVFPLVFRERFKFSKVSQNQARPRVMTHP